MYIVAYYLVDRSRAFFGSIMGHLTGTVVHQQPLVVATQRNLYWRKLIVAFCFVLAIGIATQSINIYSSNSMFPTIFEYNVLPTLSCHLSSICVSFRCELCWYGTSVGANRCVLCCPRVLHGCFGSIPIIAQVYQLGCLFSLRAHHFNL